MDKMNKFSLLLAVAMVFVAGCGKKCAKGKEKNKYAAATEIPVSAETESLFDDKVSELAFVDDELGFEKDGLMASNNIEVDRGDIADQDADRAANYAFKTVHFNFNKNDIRPDQKSVVDRDVALAKAAVADGKELVIEGHTCQIGSAAYNLVLSQRRAESVRREMVEHGVPNDAIKTMGLGYEKPLVSSDAKKRAELIKELSPNRRAEVLVS
jgi:outer membrane protein OmpA-like peptidoglycan-associated protein